MVMPGPRCVARGKDRNTGLICIIIGRMYYQRVVSLPWRFLVKQCGMMIFEHPQSPLRRLRGLEDRV